MTDASNEKIRVTLWRDATTVDMPSSCQILLKDTTLNYNAFHKCQSVSINNPDDLEVFKEFTRRNGIRHVFTPTLSSIVKWIGRACRANYEGRTEASKRWFKHSSRSVLIPIPSVVHHSQQRVSRQQNCCLGDRSELPWTICTQIWMIEWKNLRINRNFVTINMFGPGNVNLVTKFMFETLVSTKQGIYLE